MLPRDNKSSCECEITLAPGQSLARGSLLSRVHVNRPLVFSKEEISRFHIGRKVNFFQLPSDNQISRSLKLTTSQ